MRTVAPPPFPITVRGASSPGMRSDRCWVNSWRRRRFWSPARPPSLPPSYRRAYSSRSRSPMDSSIRPRSPDSSGSRARLTSPTATRKRSASAPIRPQYGTRMGSQREFSWPCWPLSFGMRVPISWVNSIGSTPSTGYTCPAPSRFGWRISRSFPLPWRRCGPRRPPLSPVRRFPACGTSARVPRSCPPRTASRGLPRQTIA